jgi:hypothetical protein
MHARVYLDGRVKLLQQLLALGRVVRGCPRVLEIGSRLSVEEAQQLLQFL